MIEQAFEEGIDLHRVKQVVEIRSAQAANELLADGWVLHEVYITSDFKSAFLLLRTDLPRCPRCQASATIELLNDGDSYRYVCQQECL